MLHRRKWEEISQKKGPRIKQLLAPRYSNDQSLHFGRKGSEIDNFFLLLILILCLHNAKGGQEYLKTHLRNIWMAP